MALAGARNIFDTYITLNMEVYIYKQVLKWQRYSKGEKQLREVKIFKTKILL